MSDAVVVEFATLAHTLLGNHEHIIVSACTHTNHTHDAIFRTIKSHTLHTR